VVAAVSGRRTRRAGLARPDRFPSREGDVAQMAQVVWWRKVTELAVAWRGGAESGARRICRQGGSTVVDGAGPGVGGAAQPRWRRPWSAARRELLAQRPASSEQRACDGVLPLLAVMGEEMEAREYPSLVLAPGPDMAPRAGRMHCFQHGVGGQRVDGGMVRAGGGLRLHPRSGGHERLLDHAGRCWTTICRLPWRGSVAAV
jgi:hypothetical protein